MPAELGLLSEGLWYLGLSRDYSLQSSLSPAALWLCAHTSAPSLELAAQCSEPQWVQWVQVLPDHNEFCEFRLLPDLCFFPVRLLNHPVSQKELSPRAVLGEPLGRGCAVGWVAALGSTQGAQCSTGGSHCVALGRITAGRTAGESHVNLISVCCLTAFLLHFSRSKSFKEGIS